MEGLRNLDISVRYTFEEFLVSFYTRQAGRAGTPSDPAASFSQKYYL
jgi:hypothetical protein